VRLACFHETLMSILAAARSATTYPIFVAVLLI
jgi:hypothetical protein